MKLAVVLCCVFLVPVVTFVPPQASKQFLPSDVVLTCCKASLNTLIMLLTTQYNITKDRSHLTVDYIVSYNIIVYKATEITTTSKNTYNRDLQVLYNLDFLLA